MKIFILSLGTTTSLMLALATVAAADPAPATASLELPTLVLQSQETANERSASTYTTPVSNLEFDPRIDLQSRNMAEAQGDITIRGGIFENTGIRVGSATLIDPQTGHYFAELPIAPEMLEPYRVLTGADNALYGFNSTVGTISYGWSEIAEGGSLTAGGGDHDLNFQRIHQGLTGPLGESGQWSWGVEAEFSRSESDGTTAFGGHDFERGTGRVQILGPRSQTDFFAGYQAKLFGWPGMYTANLDDLETENLKTRLFVLNHSHAYGDGSEFEFTAYDRRHSDHYVLRRNDPSFFEAFHETKVSSFALAGRHRLSEAWALLYSGQLTFDEIDSADFFRSTPLGGLERGRFQSRSYQKIAFAPEYRVNLNKRDSLTLRAGANFDDSNRDGSEFSGLFDATWQREHGKNSVDRVYLAYAESSQVGGYTAIGGGATGLFASNPNLERETSQNLELGGSLKRSTWSLEAAVFYRWDDDLTDWTFDSTNTSARTANPVDLETFGLELIATRLIGNFEAVASYTYLDKDEDYGPATADASFYALNFAKHRITLGGIWRPVDWLELRIDNEWRDQEENALRNSDDTAFFTHIGVSVYPPQVEDLEIFFAAENIWEEDFEDVPGTPGRGDQYSGGVRYSW